jgi:DNA-binding transcriptional regulator/RsmH inhibitor MraZ
MSHFYGQERCIVDANGRIRLSPRFLADCRAAGTEVVLFCLPEGALGIYPAAVWSQMREAEARPASRAATSVVFRRQLRRFGALSQAETVSNQGRITVPVHFRSLLDLEPGAEAVVVGSELGLEVWNRKRWEAEFLLIREHELQKAAAEMSADLAASAGAAAKTTLS